jgi:hypothetical protein
MIQETDGASELLKSLREPLAPDQVIDAIRPDYTAFWQLRYQLVALELTLRPKVKFFNEFLNKMVEDGAHDLDVNKALIVEKMQTFLIICGSFFPEENLANAKALLNAFLKKF